MAKLTPHRRKLNKRAANGMLIGVAGAQGTAMYAAHRHAKRVQHHNMLVWKGASVESAKLATNAKYPVKNLHHAMAAGASTAAVGYGVYRYNKRKEHKALKEGR